MKIYCTARNPASATIRVEDDASQPLNGSIRGPFCKFSKTLPSTVPIRDGKALVVDPCYWTPKLPFRYEVTINSGSDDATSQQFLWGIRWCVPHQRNLFLDGKGYVVRAAAWSDRFELEAFRELSCSVVTNTPLQASIYQRASELGVLIVNASTESHAEHALEPSVHFVGSSSAATQATPKCDAVPMALIESKASVTNVAGGRVCLADEALVSSGVVTDTTCPVLVVRRTDLTVLADMRRACDTLQSDLASFGQFAGYLLSAS